MKEKKSIVKPRVKKQIVKKPAIKRSVVRNIEEKAEVSLVSLHNIKAVSYTHLTLPTNREV